MPHTDNPLLIEEDLPVINLGVELFAETLQQQSVDVVHVQWTPPPPRDEELMTLLDALI